ncbi:hypothetical protein LCGC14_2746830, partial [marine sediment metagenome]
MKKSQVKIIFSMFLIFSLLISLIYAVGTTLTSPVDNFRDDDGYLDLRGKCIPSANSTVSYNITNATLYS